MTKQEATEYARLCGESDGTYEDAAEMASRASAVARLFDRVADHGQSPEEAQQELAADGVDVPAFLARVGQAIDETMSNTVSTQLSRASYDAIAAEFDAGHGDCFCVQCMGKSREPR